MNQCTFIGRLAKDVELRFTPNGKAVGNFSLAVQRELPDQNGDRQADFPNFVIWGKAAENMANQLTKGDLIAVTSRMQNRSYENNDGKTVYVTEFIVEGFPKFLRVKKWENESNNSNGAGPSRNQSGSGSNNNRGGNYTRVNDDPFANGGQTIDISDDDLPF